MKNSSILIICKIPEFLLTKYNEIINYLPNLSDENSSEWDKKIRIIKPAVILLGTGRFTREMMQIWRKYLPHENLSIVRKGVSLERRDLQAASDYSINVFNTPGINSAFVADYMSQFLFQNTLPSDRLSIIGTGKIGMAVFSKAEKNNTPTILYTRHTNYPNNKKSIVTNSLNDAFSKANKIAIALPLNESTKGIVKLGHIEIMPKNSLLICISSPKIFSNEALKKLFDRDDIFVVIDHLKSELDEVYKIINHPTLRSNFIMDEKAAASDECQEAMAQAALKKCLECTNHSAKN